MDAKNRITRSMAPKSLFESALAVIGSTSASTWNQGDLLYLDTTNHLLKKLAAEGDAVTFMGIAQQSISSGKVVSPYNTDVVASQGIHDIAGPAFGVVAKLVLKSGDALTPGALVYADPATGPYHVQAAGTKAIGIYQGASITGDGVKEVEVLLGTRGLNDTLQF